MLHTKVPKHLIAKAALTKSEKYLLHLVRGAVSDEVVARLVALMTVSDSMRDDVLHAVKTTASAIQNKGDANALMFSTYNLQDLSEDGINLLKNL